MNTGWNQKNNGPDFTLLDSPWGWEALMQNPADVSMLGSDDPYPLAIDPAALSYYNGLAANLFGIQDPSQNVGAGPQPLQHLFAPAPTIQNNLVNQGAPVTSRIPLMASQTAPAMDSKPILQLSSMSDDREIAMKAIAAAGVQAAVSAADSSQALSYAQNLLPNTPAPRLSKPDLAACPPLAKHVMSNMAASPQSNGEESTGQALGVSGRPKTSHTTIERRYRTNLNARITALRHAVPALRILDKDHAKRPEFAGDVVDERGFVDGVKAARKASKASILGKAAEYIHVLKKREIRLKHEVAGLRTLLTCLVGGETLLQEFDTNWRARYGSEESDEVAGMSDCDDGDEESEDDPLPRKKARTAKDSPPSGTSTPTATESAKRKRGRPKKTQTSPETPITTQAPAPAHMNDQLSGSTQYLLGAFLFFSLVKPSNEPYPGRGTPSPYHPSAHHQHVGSVYPTPIDASHQSGLSGLYRSWSPLVHSAHTFLSMVLLLSIVGSMFVRRFRKSTERHGRSNTALKNLMKDGAPTDPVEMERQIRVALGGRGIVGEALANFGTLLRPQSPPTDGIVESACWRLANLTLLGDTTPSLRLSSSLTLWRLLPSSPSNLSSIAFLCLPVSRPLAEFFWAKAAALALTQREGGATTTVLRTSLDEAWSLYTQAVGHGLVRSHLDDAPLLQAGQIIVLEAVNNLAEGSFIREATEFCREARNLAISSGSGADIEDATERLARIGYGVGGAAGSLLQTWLNVQQESFITVGEDLASPSPLVANARDIVLAIGWLRSIRKQVGSGRIPQPISLPPTLLLRRVLAAPVFSATEAMEDARDLLVDCMYEQ